LDCMIVGQALPDVYLFCEVRHSLTYGVLEAS
jgi:hypothetical protein